MVFGVVIGPAYALAMDREDGTLLRYKAAPHGLKGYFTSQLFLHSMGMLPQMVVILLPSFLLFDNLMADPSGWFTMVWVLLLGLLAAMPIGMVIGALVPNTQKVGSWGMLPVMFLGGISGIFYPVQQLWGWVEVLAQAFPMYWLGLGMRSAFLPDSAAALEVGGSWRPVETMLRPGSLGGGRHGRDTCGSAPDGPSRRPVPRSRPPATPRCSGSNDRGRSQPDRGLARGTRREPQGVRRRARSALPDRRLPRTRRVQPQPPPRAPDRRLLRGVRSMSCSRSPRSPGSPPSRLEFPFGGCRVGVSFPRLPVIHSTESA